MSDLPDWKALPQPKRIEAVRALMHDGLSASEAAQRFSNCTRNSIISLCHRKNIKMAVSPGPVRSPAAKPKKHGNIGQPKVQAIVAKAAHMAPPPIAPFDVEDNPDVIDVTHLVGIMHLERRSCRWPMHGEGANTLFCGKHAHHGPYCPEHSSRAGIGYGKGARP